MKTIDWKYTSVGQIVADDFAAASVFKKYGIDFCCHGEVMLEKACADLGLAVEKWNRLCSVRVKLVTDGFRLLRGRWTC